MNNQVIKLNLLLHDNIAAIKKTFGESADLNIRKITHKMNGEMNTALLYMEGLADEKIIIHLVASLKTSINEVVTNQSESPPQDLIKLLENTAVIVGNTEISDLFQMLYNALLSGSCVLLVDGYDQGITIATSGGEHRKVTEPLTQTVVRGPQEAFTETIRINTSLIRRKIRDPNLWLESKQIGRVTKTDVSIMYIKGIIDDTVVEEVRKRLDSIDIDSILESSYIEELIEDGHYTLFPTVNNTERPDVAASALLEGRLVILIDGTPFVLIVPALFAQFMQSAEDYYHRSDFGLVRLLRYMALFIALFGPAFYIAITTYHQEMLPTPLLISLAAQREGVPFPAFIEALIMEVTFEFLREAAIRMPRAIGTSISIVGALVLGQAAVEAGIISPAMVILVSITAITSFTFPSFDFGIATRILRFGMMSFAATFGFFGIIIGFIAIVLHLCHLNSFGISYMAPFAPFNKSDQKDTIVRLPWWRMITRPSSTHTQNPFRQSTSAETAQQGSDPNHTPWGKE